MRKTVQPIKTCSLSLNSEEQQPLEEFFQAKGLKTRNEMLDDVSNFSFISLAEISGAKP